VGTRCADHVTPLYPQKLVLTSLTGGGRSVGIVRSRTKAMEFSLDFVYSLSLCCPSRYKYASIIIGVLLHRKYMGHCTQQVAYRLRPTSFMTIWQLFILSPSYYWPARSRTQHDYHHDTKVKPEAAIAVTELLMMGGKTPETCWAVNKRQDNKLENCCIRLVIYLN
jgi:hypothetical protein